MFEIHKVRERSSVCMRKLESIFFYNETLGETELSHVFQCMKADLPAERATENVTPLIGYLITA